MERKQVVDFTIINDDKQHSDWFLTPLFTNKWKGGFEAIKYLMFFSLTVLLCLGHIYGSSIAIYHDPVLNDIRQHKPHVVFTQDTLDNRKTLKRFTCCSKSNQLLCVPKSIRTIYQAKTQSICRFEYLGMTFAVMDELKDLHPSCKQKCFVKTKTGIFMNGLGETKSEEKWTFIPTHRHKKSPLDKRIPYVTEMMLRFLLINLMIVAAFGSWFLVYGKRQHKRFVF